ncbi:MAG: crossover junction endodeoxyribonuclease RuvC [Candidatus Liptonbacteria bacterium]|nr:crossover junction endodeoxyribonuclease RuvC [Candidatus Liptonbacteria bacterium]
MKDSSRPVILGIDPGSRRVGFGVVRNAAEELQFIDAGTLEIKIKDNAGALRAIRDGTRRLINRYHPRVIAVERLFFSKNRRTALPVAEARGVILLVASEANAATLEFTPNEVKMGVTGHGSASKTAVAKMVRLILKKPDLSVVDDATDALALAICACSARR